jgi:hypothetical protein
MVDGPAKSESPVGGKHPIILLGFLPHPFGGAGFGNHPQYEILSKKSFSLLSLRLYP